MSERSYGDPCGIARALDLVGERWALLVVRELVLGPKRFTELRDGLAGASPNVLSQRLSELEAGGVVRKLEAGPGAYELTDWGKELHPVLGAAGALGSPVPGQTQGQSQPYGILGCLGVNLQSERGRPAERTLRTALRRTTVWHRGPRMARFTSRAALLRVPTW